MSQGRRPSGRSLRRGLVAGLEAAAGPLDPAVRKAFLAVPRECFLPATAARDGLEAVYANEAIVTRTGEGGAPTSSSSQPGIMAPMLEALALRPGHRALEIGTGTGYNAALLSTLVGPDGHVTSVELQPDVAAEADAALRAGGYPVEVVVGDGHLGWPAEAPYDRIVATASTAVVPRPWRDQLAPEGLLEVPLHLATRDLQAVVTFRGHDDGDGLRSTAVLNGGFMVLRGREPVADAARLSVTESIDGEHRSLGTLSGDGLRALRPAARDRLTRLMLERPTRRSRLGPLTDGRSPGLFLRLATPRHAVMLTYFRTGASRMAYQPVAVATPDGRSLAVLSVVAATGLHLESFGEARAAEIVTDLLERWHAGGRPGFADLVVDVTFDATGASRVVTSWR